MEAEAQTILIMPINTRGEKDKLIWGLTVDGTFSVKSAYATALAMKILTQGKLLMQWSKPVYGRIFGFYQNLRKFKIFYEELAITPFPQITTCTRRSDNKRKLPPSMHPRGRNHDPLDVEL